MLYSISTKLYQNRFEPNATTEHEFDFTLYVLICKCYLYKNIYFKAMMAYRRHCSLVYIPTMLRATHATVKRCPFRPFLVSTFGYLPSLYLSIYFMVVPKVKIMYCVQKNMISHEDTLKTLYRLILVL